MLPEAICGAWGYDDYRKARLIGQREPDETAAWLRGVELLAILGQCLPDGTLEVSTASLVDILPLSGRVPIGAFGFVATDRAIGAFVPDFMLPVVKMDLEFSVALF
jgi:hypothetical protein